jgi:hypothetical protein
MLARVVDLPDPVGPVTCTNPRGRRARLLTWAGMPRASSGLSPGDQPERGPDGVALEVDVEPEAGLAGQRVGAVQLLLALQPLPLPLGQDE